MFLIRLREGCPALTSDVGGSMAEAASICLEDRGHQITVNLHVRGDYNKVFVLHRMSATDQMRRCHNDLQDATEQGAYGVAILAVRELVNLTVVERSRKGTGFDYWLGDENDYPFQNKARLEVSGILEGDQSIIDARVKQKIEQTTRSDATRLPSYVAVLEYSQPAIYLVKRVVKL